MGEAKHTPGPWDFCRTGRWWQVYAESERDDGINSFLADKIEKQEDARLIAAAPDLLAALKECADDLAVTIEHQYAHTKDHPAMARRYERDMAPVVAARAIIAKTEGRPIVDDLCKTEAKP